MRGPGHMTPYSSRASRAEAVTDLPGVQASARLQATAERDRAKEELTMAIPTTVTAAGLPATSTAAPAGRLPRFSFGVASLACSRPSCLETPTGSAWRPRVIRRRDGPTETPGLPAQVTTFSQDGG